MELRNGEEGRDWGGVEGTKFVIFLIESQNRNVKKVKNQKYT